MPGPIRSRRIPYLAALALPKRAPRGPPQLAKGARFASVTRNSPRRSGSSRTGGVLFLQGDERMVGPGVRLPQTCYHATLTAVRSAGLVVRSALTSVTAMSRSSIFSTYRSGENRVTSSMLAVFQRVGMGITEQVLSMAVGEASLGLVAFSNQPSGDGSGVPDAEIQASFRYLIETKTSQNQFASDQPDAQLLRHLERLDGSHADERLLVVTPDVDQPLGIGAMGDDRVVWLSFTQLAQAIDAIVVDPSEPASEQQRFLLRELVSFFEAEGLVGVDDTVVVAGRWAYPTYLKTGAYICQPNRSIRPVPYMGFYIDKQIQPEVPRVLKYFRNIEVDEETIRSLQESQDPLDTRLSEVLQWRLHDQSHEQSNDVYILSTPGDPETLLLGAPIRHDGRGAWVQGQRYTSSARLRDAAHTSDLG